MNKDCVNLRERFGQRYRAQYGPNARIEDPWLQIFPCKAGHIFPWGRSILAASTNSRGPTATKLAALDFATLHQDGDDRVTVLFPVERFSKVAALMHPKRRRQMTAKQRQRLVEAGAKYRFSDGVHVAPGGQITLATAGTVFNPGQGQGNASAGAAANPTPIQKSKEVTRRWGDRLWELPLSEHRAARGQEGKPA